MQPATALVLFDIDGTLMRNAGSHHKDALIEGVRQVTGVRTTLEGVSTSGMLDCDLIAGMLRSAGLGDDRIRADMDGMIQASQDAYLEHCAPTLTDKVCPGVPDVMRRLQDRGALLGVVTGNFSRIAWKKLELAGLRSYFSLGAFAEDGKTRTDLAQAAGRNALAEHLITPETKISLVGDHANDILAAQRSGYYSVAVATGFLSVAELESYRPQIVVNDLTELDLSRLF